MTFRNELLIHSEDINDFHGKAIAYVLPITSAIVYSLLFLSFDSVHYSDDGRRTTIEFFGNITEAYIVPTKEKFDEESQHHTLPHSDLLFLGDILQRFCRLLENLFAQVGLSLDSFTTCSTAVIRFISSFVFCFVPIRINVFCKGRNEVCQIMAEGQKIFLS